MEDLIRHKYREADLSMSNINYGEIDKGLAELLQSGEYYACHYAVCFCGAVWWDREQQVFKEQVWQYHIPGEVYEASTLEELMNKVNDIYGYE